MKTRAVDLPFEVFSYSSESDLPEQIASIRSFFRYVGRPLQFTVVSDGSHSARGLALLCALGVSVSTVPEPVNVPDRMKAYLTQHPTGRQLALIMSLPRNAPALYIDSDVLFFRGGCPFNGKTLRYLADCQFSGDERLLRDAKEKENPVNTGVLYLPSKVDWSAGIDRFLELDGPPNFFTNQTITHLAMHANGAQPFDPAKFVLQLDDQFIYRDKYAAPELVLRHYVNPVRHKFWTALFPG